MRTILFIRILLVLQICRWNDGTGPTTTASAWVVSSSSSSWHQGFLSSERDHHELQQHNRRQQPQENYPLQRKNRIRSRRTVGCLGMSGRGSAQTYSWEEEAFEIDVTIKVPKETRAKDIVFRATSNSIELRLRRPRVRSETKTKIDDGGEEKLKDEDIILMDPKRKLRGRINVDGTYWVISDGDDDNSENEDDENYRKVTVTIEKLIRTPQDDFQVVEYDWKGIYSNDDAEVLERTYDKPEKLDIREYAASLGVDIDNIDMSKVDKTMFSSDLNLTKSSLKQLQDSGYIAEEEVTRQADGTEYTVNPQTGEPEKYEPFAPSMPATKPLVKQQQPPQKVPFLDTDSPWHAATPATTGASAARAAAAAPTPLEPAKNSKEIADREEETELAPVVSSVAPIDPITISRNINSNQNITQFARNFTRAAFAAETAKNAVTSTATTTTAPIIENGDVEQEEVDEDRESSSSRTKNPNAKDPIDTLTVKRLKEILKSQGLKTSGTKQELQDRLRQQVNSILQGKQ